MEDEQDDSSPSSSPCHVHGQRVSAFHTAAISGERATLQKLIAGSDPEELESVDGHGRTPLTYAVLADRPECVEVLLKAGVTVDLADASSRTALHWAAHKGHVQCMKLLLSRGAQWKLRDGHGRSVLHLCARQSSQRCLALLLKVLGPGDIDDLDNSKKTALHWSALSGYATHVRMLVKHDANIGLVDAEGKTALHWAASCRQVSSVQCAKILLDWAPSVINWQDYEGRTPLHLAVADGTQAVVDLLTTFEKCNINPMDNMFRTPLHWTAVLDLPNIAAILLDRKADASCSDANGATPLHYAAQNNYPATVEVFLSRTDAIDEPDLEGRRALMWAAGKGADDVIQTMHRCHVDLTASDKHGATALHAAALAGHVPTVCLLLQLGVPLEAHDFMRHTPLFYACEMGHADVVQTLVESSADVHWLDAEGKSAMHWAALGGHAFICQILIKQKLEPNFKDLCGRTALHCAAFGGYVDCMATLLENGSWVSAPDNEGMTALHWACSRGHVTAVKLLLDYGCYANPVALTDDSYTPLDLALLGEHHDAAQCLIEHGGVSINRIQEVAAVTIQAYYRGYRVRKTFIDRRCLLLKHEELKRKAARQRARNGSVRSCSVQSRLTIASGDSMASTPECVAPPTSRNPSATSNLEPVCRLSPNTVAEEQRSDTHRSSLDIEHTQNGVLAEVDRSDSPEMDVTAEREPLSTFDLDNERDSIEEYQELQPAQSDHVDSHPAEKRTNAFWRFVTRSEKSEPSGGSRIGESLSINSATKRSSAPPSRASRCASEFSVTGLDLKPLTPSERPKLRVEMVKTSCLDVKMELKRSPAPSAKLLKVKSVDNDSESSPRVGLLQSLRMKITRPKGALASDTLESKENKNPSAHASSASKTKRCERSAPVGSRSGRGSISALQPDEAASVIQQAWKRFVKRKRNHKHGCLWTPFSTSEREARLAAQEIWNQCLFAVSLQDQLALAARPISATDTSDEKFRSRANSMGSMPPLMFQASHHYSYNLQNQRNGKPVHPR